MDNQVIKQWVIEMRKASNGYVEIAYPFDGTEVEVEKEAIATLEEALLIASYPLDIRVSDMENYEALFTLCEEDIKHSR